MLRKFTRLLLLLPLIVCYYCYLQQSYISPPSRTHTSYSDSQQPSKLHEAFAPFQRIEELQLTDERLKHIIADQATAEAIRAEVDWKKVFRQVLHLDMTEMELNTLVELRSLDAALSDANLNALLTSPKLQDAIVHAMKTQSDREIAYALQTANRFDAALPHIVQQILDMDANPDQVLDNPEFDKHTRIAPLFQELANRARPGIIDRITKKIESGRYGSIFLTGAKVGRTSVTGIIMVSIVFKMMIGTLELVWQIWRQKKEPILVNKILNKLNDTEAYFLKHMTEEEQDITTGIFEDMKGNIEEVLSCMEIILKDAFFPENTESSAIFTLRYVARTLMANYRTNSKEQQKQSLSTALIQAHNRVQKVSADTLAYVINDEVIMNHLVQLLNIGLSHLGPRMLRKTLDCDKELLKELLYQARENMPTIVIFVKRILQNAFVSTQQETTERLVEEFWKLKQVYHDHGNGLDLEEQIQKSMQSLFIYFQQRVLAGWDKLRQDDPETIEKLYDFVAQMVEKVKDEKTRNLKRIRSKIVTAAIDKIRSDIKYVATMVVTNAFFKYGRETTISLVAEYLAQECHKLYAIFKREGLNDAFYAALRELISQIQINVREEYKRGFKESLDAYALDEISKTASGKKVESLMRNIYTRNMRRERARKQQQLEQLREDIRIADEAQQAQLHRIEENEDEEPTADEVAAAVALPNLRVPTNDGSLIARIARWKIRAQKMANKITKRQESALGRPN